MTQIAYELHTLLDNPCCRRRNAAVRRFRAVLASTPLSAVISLPDRWRKRMVSRLDERFHGEGQA
jgi:hypothetical protein